MTFSAQTIGTAISPDGTKVASQTGGDNAGIPQLSITDAATGSVLQTFGGTGVAAPVYSPNGTALYTATSTSVLKYVVGGDGKVINPSSPLKIALPSGALPYGLGISADGKTLYAAESGINKLGIIDTATGSVTGQVAVGNAPQGVAVVDGKVFVSNRGGRPAVAGDTTNLSDGTAIVSDPSTGASATGTVSVVDPTVKTPVIAPTAPNTSATAPDIIDVDFADGTPAEHAQNLPETTYGAPSIAKDAGLGQNVATFNGTTDAYTYPFGDQWSKVAKSFTIECKFRWNGAAVDNNGHGVCEDLNGGGIGVDILNGEPMTYAHIGGAYKKIFDPHPVVSGTWYDVITTWDGSTLREYVNGTQVATMAASGALGLPSPDTSWHWTIGANAAPTPAGIEAPARVSVASSKVWSKALPGGPSVPVTVPTTPDTSAKTPDVLSVDFADGTSADHAEHTVTTAPDTSATPAILNVDFADGTPVDHAQNLPETTYGAPSIANDPTAGKNVATFNGTTEAYTYPFSAEWPKVANGFTVECKFRWNGATPTAGDHGVCSDTNGGGIGVHVLNGEPMTYAFIGGAYKTIYDPTPVVPGTWYDVITTWDGNYLDEYVNGKLVATQYATGALGLPSPANTSWHWTIGADASTSGIELISPVSVATSKIWDKGLPAGPKVAIPDTLPTTTYGTPSIAKDAGLGQNVATFNGTTDAYTYPFDDQWSKVAKGFTIECKFRWNDPAGPTTADHGVCSDTNSGGIGVHVVNGEPMTYALHRRRVQDDLRPEPGRAGHVVRRRHHLGRLDPGRVRQRNPRRQPGGLGCDGPAAAERDRVPLHDRCGRERGRHRDDLPGQHRHQQDLEHRAAVGRHHADLRHRQPDRHDQRRPAAGGDDGARRRGLRRQHQRRHRVDHRRRFASGDPDLRGSAAAWRDRGRGAELDRVRRRQSPTGERRARQRDRGVQLHRRAAAGRLQGPDPDGLVPEPGVLRRQGRQGHRQQPAGHRHQRLPADLQVPGHPDLVQHACRQGPATPRRRRSSTTTAGMSRSRREAVTPPVSTAAIPVQLGQPSAIKHVFLHHQGEPHLRPDPR